MDELPGSLVSTDWLATHIDDEHLIIADIRWKLGEHGAGRRAFNAGRIPRSIFVDIDDDLSDIGDPKRGRHPLPDPSVLVGNLARAGIGRGARVIAYDDLGGTLAARLWWLARWLHNGFEVALLDGGIPTWIAEGRPIETGTPRTPTPAAEPVPAEVDAALVTLKPEVLSLVTTRARTPILLDARAPERFRGEIEPIDPIPGHIPGARNAPTSANLEAGRFRTADVLRAHFAALGVARGADAICYCGSGVTACHDLFALDRAGLDGARLYAGSWSEWVHDPDCPIATGPTGDAPR